MELVTTALSKNPYLTVAQKHEHIDWYRNYFEEKKAVIEESLVHAEEAKVLEQTNKWWIMLFQKTVLYISVQILCCSGLQGWCVFSY